MAEKDDKKAIGHYEKAIQLDPDYFGSYLGAGVAQYCAGGNKAKAEELLTQSAKLLPTAPAAYYLGELAKGRGDIQKAMQLLSGRRELAKRDRQSGDRRAGSPGPAAELRELRGTGGQLDSSGRVVVHYSEPRANRR